MSNVSLYDGWFASNPIADWGSLSMLLATDSYTFDSAHVLTDITPFEVTDSGYSRASGAISNDGTGSTTVANYGLGSKGLSFPGMTVANWRYAIAYDGSSRPLFCADAGSAQSLSDEVLTLNGQAFTITASG